MLRYLGITEIVLIVVLLLIFAGGFVGMILGMMAFFKARRLEKKVAELQSRLQVIETSVAS